MPRSYPELAWLLIPSQVSNDVITLMDAEPTVAATAMEPDVKGAKTSAAASSSGVECQICLEKPPSAAYVPCGHSGTRDSVPYLHLLLSICVHVCMYVYVFHVCMVCCVSNLSGYWLDSTSEQRYWLYE